MLGGKQLTSGDHGGAEQMKKSVESDEHYRCVLYLNSPIHIEMLEQKD